MKKISYTLLVAFCWACSTTAPQKDKMGHATLRVFLHKPKRLSLVGDFDGKGKKDTIVEEIYSSIRRTQMDSVPDPYQNDKDSIITWFDAEGSEVRLRLDTSTLHLGLAQRLYCLINVGDNNKDGKDEVAVVLDSLDQSSINTCSIYSLCNGKWMILKQFSIHENAFEMMNDEGLEGYRYIKGYLEQKNGTWWYSDYLLGRGIDRTSRSAKWQKLNLNKCP